MKCCLVFSCKNKGNIEGVHYFKLTKKRFAVWAQLLNRDPAESLSPDNVVCSDHFDAECFEIKNNKVTLKKGAVPMYNLGVRRTLFPPVTTVLTIAQEVAGPSTLSVRDVTFKKPQDVSVIPMEEVQSGNSGSQKLARITPTTPTSSGNLVSRHNIKKCRRAIQMMHSYNIPPRKMKVSFEQLKRERESLKKKLHASEIRSNRLKRKLQRLAEVTRVVTFLNFDPLADHDYDLRLAT